MMVLVGAMYATAGTARALGPSTASSMGVAAVRLGLGALVFMLMLVPLGGRYAELPHLFRRPAVWIAALLSALFQTLYFVGVTLDGVALGGLLTMGSVPVFSGLLGALFGHRINRAWALATLIATVGLVLLSIDGIDGGSFVGVLAALGAGLAGGAFTVALKRMLDQGESEIPLSACTYTLAASLLLPALLLQSPEWLLTPQGIAMALYLGIVAMAIPNILWIKALATLPPGPASTLMLTDPAVATILGVVVFGERLAWTGIVGICLVVVGLVLQGRFLTRGGSSVEIPLAAA